MARTGRPKLQNRDDVKVKVNLTITPKQREMLVCLSETKGISASELLGKWIERDYKAFEKKNMKQSES